VCGDRAFTRSAFLLCNCDDLCLRHDMLPVNNIYCSYFDLLFFCFVLLV
jgi:hypothetical protein